MLILAPSSTALPQNDKQNQAEPKVELQFLESFLFLPVFLVG